MKKLSDLDTRIDDLYDIINGRIKTQLLLTAIELNVFDYLSTPQSGEAVAEQLNTHPMYTRFLLDGLTALHLVDKKDGCYRNHPNTRATLHSESPAYQGQMFSMMEKMSAAVLADMGHTVRFGPREKPADMSAEPIWEAYARSMANYERGGTAQKMAARIAQIEGFASFEKMLDLGGGPGLHCLATVAEHPSMQGVIFDQPAVVKVAEEFIVEYEMADRVTTMADDYVNDSIGENYDLIWASATLNVVRSDLKAVIEKIYHALKPDGVFVSLADGVTHERTRPESYVLGCMSWMFSGQDLMFDKGEIAEVMRSVGFSSVESSTVDTSMVPMELDIARK
ncbi:O-methyltransferase [Desulfosarcina ovata subsp. sediminis]|uniref:O-methyltransferase n=1 Tax=Desulfosarcina ovata subsp. sediminis TaxID=885957 RepID=A0A5K7ZZ97_9BACT|nr:methyltransferase [Desulfosarcina ovata]BBO85430.1 O-methyltransferase [Desulfosarcina ovata subsp. sediminis]